MDEKVTYTVSRQTRWIIQRNVTTGRGGSITSVCMTWNHDQAMDLAVKLAAQEGAEVIDCDAAPTPPAE